jgi:hypothetical protein
VVAPFAENLFVDILPFVVWVVDIHFSFGDNPYMDSLIVNVPPFDIPHDVDIALSSVDAHPSYVGNQIVGILPSFAADRFVEIPPSFAADRFVEILPSFAGNLFVDILPSFAGNLFVDILPSFEDNSFADIPQKIAFYLSILSLLPIWYTIVYVHLEKHA